MEDDGQAIVTEEGITAMVFSHAKCRDFLEDNAEIDPDLLRIIREMTSHLEVSERNRQGVGKQGKGKIHHCCPLLSNCLMLFMA